MKVTIGQIKIVVGQPQINFQTIQEAVSKAKNEGSDLIVFPEMCIGGYFNGDRYLDHDYLTLLHTYNDRIKSLSDDIGIIWGNVFYEPLDSITKGRDGRPVRFNAAFFAYNQAWVSRASQRYSGLYIKHLNPDYRMFDDSRYFLSALEIMTANHEQESPFLAPFVFNRHGQEQLISLEICEDLWDDDYPSQIMGQLYQYHPDLLVNISSSPWTLNKEKARARHLSQKAKVPTLYVNAVSMQDTGKNVFAFDGGSLLFNAHGEKVLECDDHFNEDVLTVDLNKVETRTKVYQNSKLLDALLFVIKEFDYRMFKAKVKWIIGLSGGIDSTVNAALLTLALGQDRVLGYNLPSRYNSSKTISNAENLAKSLGISYHTYAIEPLIQATKSLFEGNVTESVEENVHARLRGHVLSTIAQMQGGVICNNGNKLEVALGYCTLYGDTIGALSPLGDLTKMQINDLALEINRLFAKEVVPSNLIANMIDGIPHYEFAPSAELKRDQIDPMKWGYHDYLLNRIMTFPTRNINQFIDDYMHDNLDENTKNFIKYYGLDNKAAFLKDLRWFISNFENSVFKRIQMPPIVTISRGAFGYDYRETQAKIEQYLNLE